VLTTIEDMLEAILAVLEEASCQLEHPHPYPSPRQRRGELQAQPQPLQAKESFELPAT
jgi:hypothetical protein